MSFQNLWKFSVMLWKKIYMSVNTNNRPAGIYLACSDKTASTLEMSIDERKV